MPGERKEYLICSNDFLQTAFFCGTASEVAYHLGLKSADVLRSALSHGRNNFLRGFCHVEPAPPEKLEEVSR